MAIVLTIMAITFPEYLICAKLITCMISFTPHKIPERWVHLFPSYKGGNQGMERFLGGEAWVQAQDYLKPEVRA